jgi:hypothetical protein
MMGREDKARGEHYFQGDCITILGGWGGACWRIVLLVLFEDLVVVLLRNLLWFC